MLIITHPALNRITFFDLDRHAITGALPAQKLPHDMLLSGDRRTLYVVSSGAQCIGTYHLDSPDLWKYAAAFMIRDSANLFKPHPVSGGSMFGSGHDSSYASVPAVNADSAALSPPATAVYLNRDPVQSLPGSVASFHLTEPWFPAAAKSKHDRVGAMFHSTCFDCHDRSLGGKPFGPGFAHDSSEIFLVHLASRNITFLDVKTLEVRRQIPLAIPADYSPVEAWLQPDGRRCFVTCRNAIGMSRPGLILAVDVASGAITKSITAGIYPWHLMPDSSGQKLYINNFQSSRISILDVGKMEIIDSIIVQNGPSMMKLLPDRGLLMVSCFYTDKVLVVDLASHAIIHEIAVDGNPTSLELTPSGDGLYVLCGGGGALDLIDMKSYTVAEKYKMLFGAYAFASLGLNADHN